MCIMTVVTREGREIYIQYIDVYICIYIHIYIATSRGGCWENLSYEYATSR
jgi:hypothetical protein